jgi:GNAT superfamily N-acetyltransferase
MKTVFCKYLYKSGFFMLTKIVLKQFCSYLKQDKYKGIVQEVKIEYCTDDDDTVYIHLNTIKIKKPKRNQGYGTKVLVDIVNFADKYNVRVQLYASNIFGSDVNRLYEFYERRGFARIVEDKDGLMIRPKKKVEIYCTN